MKTFLTIVVALIVSIVIWVCLDMFLGKPGSAYGKVIGREYVPGHYENRVYGSGKESRISTVWVADSYKLIVSAEEEAIQIEVNRTAYYTIKDGNVVPYRFRAGKWSHVQYLRQLNNQDF